MDWGSETQALRRGGRYARPSFAGRVGRRIAPSSCGTGDGFRDPLVNVSLAPPHASGADLHLRRKRALAIQEYMVDLLNPVRRMTSDSGMIVSSSSASHLASTAVHPTLISTVTPEQMGVCLMRFAQSPGDFALPTTNCVQPVQCSGSKVGPRSCLMKSGGLSCR